MGIYDFKVKAQDGSEVPLSDYKGKVLLIVDTATGCGFTPHYTEPQELYDTCHEQGLEILDFPCNQSGDQAPGSDEEIHAFCTGRFGMSPMGLAMSGIAKKMDKDCKKNGNVKWNFTKFLISRDGQILARFEPTTPMKTVMEKVKAAL